MNKYHTISPVENILYKDKASKFIGFVYPVKNDIEIKEKLAYLRNLHPKATHHCYAYRLGLDKNNYRANDDGEPNGTAGKPILGQIDSYEITNCLIVIIRYFGGTKLGVSGLMEAYKESAKQTIEATKIIEQKILNYYEVKCSYEKINSIYKIIHQLKATILHQDLDNLATFIITIDDNDIHALEAKLTDGQIEYKFLERK